MRVAYDRDALYLLAQGAIEPGTTVARQCQKHATMGVFSDESLEVFWRRTIIKNWSMQPIRTPIFIFVLSDGFFYLHAKRDISCNHKASSRKARSRRHWLWSCAFPYATLETGRPQPGTRCWLILPAIDVAEKKGMLELERSRIFTISAALDSSTSEYPIWNRPHHPC